MYVSDDLYSVFEAVCGPTSRRFLMVSSVSLKGNASKRSVFCGAFLAWLELLFSKRLAFQAIECDRWTFVRSLAWLETLAQAIEPESADGFRKSENAIR